MKTLYRKKNLYTFDQLVEALSSSRTITIHPSRSEDFLDYGKLFDFIYKKLTGQVKQNHIFTCYWGNPDEICVKKSVLEHDYSILRIMQRQVFDLTYPQVL